MAKPWYERIQEVDRRIIYLVVFVVVSIPLFVAMRLPLQVSPPAQSLFDCVEKISESNKKAAKEKIVLLQIAWDPSVKAECEPQTRAMIEHLMMRDIKFAIISWLPEGPQLAEDIAEACAKKYGKEYGTDWVDWGYKYMGVAAFLAFIKDIYSQVQKDIKDTPIRQVPMMKDVEGLRDVALVFYVTGSGGIEWYIDYALPEIGFDIGSGCTAIIGPEMYPYLDSKQVIGMMEGLSGAAQYEKLIQLKEGRATVGMTSQNLAHLWIITMIVLGNLGYLLQRRRQRKKAKGEER